MVISVLILAYFNFNFSDSLEKIGKLTNTNLYDNFAYHTILLNDFAGHGQYRLGGGTLSGSNASSVYSTRSVRVKRNSSSRMVRRGSFQGNNSPKSKPNQGKIQSRMSTVL